MRPLIVALDTETDKEAHALVKRLSPYVDLFKVGPVLFLKYGGPFLQELQAAGAKIFLDLKFHDIPSVVAKAVERAGEWGVYSATIHTSGGAAMMREASAVAKRPLLWGVTILTSLDPKDLKSLGITRTLPMQARQLATLALKSGLDGVISSVREAKEIKKHCGKTFQVVTPGIRLAAGGDDQKRTETPAGAIKEGSDFFVMGRPILEAPDPVQRVRDIYHSIGIHL